MDLSLSLFSSVSFYFLYVVALLSVRTRLGILCLLGEPIVKCCLFFPLIIFFAQKSPFSDITVATSTVF